MFLGKAPEDCHEPTDVVQGSIYQPSCPPPPTDMGSGAVPQASAPELEGAHSSPPPAAGAAKSSLLTVSPASPKPPSSTSLIGSLHRTLVWPTVLVSKAKLPEADQHTLLAIRALDFTIIARLGALFAEMAFLLTVPTGDSIWVTGLVTFLAGMTFLATVEAGFCPTCWTIPREMSRCKLSE